MGTEQDYMEIEIGDGNAWTTRSGMGIMKTVLIITAFYAPWNTIGAVRVSKFTKYLSEFGWKPIVLSLQIPPTAPRSLPVEIAENLIYRTEWLDPGKLFYKSHQLNTEANLSFAINRRTTSLKKLKKIIRSIIVPSYTRLPDRFIGWLPFAISAGCKLIDNMPIDAIFSSAGPVTSTLVGCILSYKYRLPWVADFRDLWSQNHLEKRPKLFQIFEETIERLVLKNASAIVTVSKQLAEQMELFHRKKDVIVIPNGYDEEDYCKHIKLIERFTLSYTGSIYPGKRDPINLFRSLSILKREGIINHRNFELRFFGEPMGNVPEQVRECNIEDLVQFYGHVSFQDSISHQMESSALLLLEWVDQSAKGVLTGKLFEYLGAGRPILAIAPYGGAIEEVLHDTGAGIIATTTSEICMILRKWIDAWYFGDKTLGLNRNNAQIYTYTRRRQAHTLAELLESIDNRTLSRVKKRSG